MTDAAVNPLKAGLEDVVVSPSEICFIDGHKGRLIYRGYDVDDLVAHSTFEERSEERRVGKECQSTCRSRWSPYH